METLSLISWNVNGMRAAERKGFLDWLKKSPYDIVCVQETKVSDPCVLNAEMLNPDGFSSYWACSTEKKGYSGVAMYTKEKPLKVEYGIGIPKFDDEGRLLVLYYPNPSDGQGKKLVVITGYFPNAGTGPERLKYKLEFYDAFLLFINKLKKKSYDVIFCGDVNTAHEAIDLARPKANEENTGFLPIERAWMDELVNNGWVDIFRNLNPDKKDVYTYWDQKTRSRDRNVGWRIDYFFTNQSFMKNVKSFKTLTEYMGSDHCPIMLDIIL